MTPDQIQVLADATAQVLSGRLDASLGFVLVIFETRKDGDVIYRSDCDSSDVAGLLRTVAEEVEDGTD